MLKSFIRRLQSIQSESPPLGRWCRKDMSKNNWKIDMANVDHCGTCAHEPSKPDPIIKDLEKPLEQVKPRA